ncbi:hypothetical protein ABVK25_006575 [Lepraria finkii]|uniref:Uncharacterized protein n=1 Tax=Lepraria finkii TaxID=1340010 RepID=A0ABR4B6K3_9LECA
MGMMTCTISTYLPSSPSHLLQYFYKSGPVKIQNLMQLFRNSLHLVSFILALGARKATATKIEPGQPAVDCDPQDRYYLNATGASTLNDPFRTPTGPLSNGSKEWTWSVGTESYTIDTSTTPNVTSIRQILWLGTDPIQIYKTPNLGYLGCGLLIHGLKQSTVAKGQNDTSGTCGSVLSDAGSATLLSVTAEIGTIASDSNAEPIEQICDLWQLNTDWGKQGAPPECADTFEKWAWIEGFPFTSPKSHPLATAPQLHSKTVPTAALMCVVARRRLSLGASQPTLQRI